MGLKLKQRRRHGRKEHGDRAPSNRSLCPLLWATFSKFVVLLKTALTFNHKTNDASVSKIDHKF